MAAANAMPENKFNFAPSNGEFSDVHSFGEQIKHLAATNYILASAVLGEKPPNQEHDEMAPEPLKSKDQIMLYLRGSFAYLHRAAAAIEQNDQETTLKAFDNRTRPGSDRRRLVPFLGPLRPDCRIFANEWHRSASQPLTP